MSKRKYNLVRNYSNIKEMFLKLTQYNVPYGREHSLLPLLPRGIKRDEVGNYYYKIGESRTMFSCHLDDASWGSYGFGGRKVNHVIEGEMISTDGTTVLGADDKAGVTILLFMIHSGVPGTYYFFIGEESGMVGSGGIVGRKSDWFSENFDRCVAFDRRAYGSIISRQIGRDCCSSEFVEALSVEYGKHGMRYTNDPTGIYTDSASFIGIIPECTNLSVGYFHEHSHSETQNIVYLEQLAKTSCKIDWENLPIVGVKNSYGHSRYSYFGDGWEIY